MNIVLHNTTGSNGHPQCWVELIDTDGCAIDVRYTDLAESALYTCAYMIRNHLQHRGHTGYLSTPTYSLIYDILAKNPPVPNIPYPVDDLITLLELLG